MTYNLKLNEIQASMLSRIIKEEIMKQRKWKKEEKEEEWKNARDYLAANMWELIEQLCEQNPALNYWCPDCMNKTDEEEEELKKVKWKH